MQGRRVERLALRRSCRLDWWSVVVDGDETMVGFVELDENSRVGRH